MKRLIVRGDVAGSPTPPGAEPLPAPTGAGSRAAPRCGTQSFRCALILAWAASLTLASAQGPFPINHQPSTIPPPPSTLNPLPAAPAATNVLRLSVADGIVMALDRNTAFRVQRLDPAIIRTREDNARAAFDPSLDGTIARSRQHAPANVLSSTTTSDAPSVVESTTAQAVLGTTLPTGTRVELNGATDLTESTGDHAASRLGATVTQPLLDGFGTGPNLVVLRQSRLDTQLSVWELRGFALALVADVERACWTYVLAQFQREAYRDALHVAEQQQAETRERIRVGKLADLDAVAADAEVALRREGLIQSESDCEAARLHLVRLLNPAQPGLWQLTPAIGDDPLAPAAALDPVETCVTRALRQRPDLNQARLSIERGDLELVKTRNGLLPRLDLFASLGRSGYAASFNGSIGGDADPGRDVSVGLQLNVPLGNRSAKADHRRAILSRDQSAEALNNLCQLAQEDVRTAWVQAHTSDEQVVATLASRTLQERKLDAEMMKFREGKSTPLLVAQAQRDLLGSKLAYVQAVVAAILARTDLHRLDGSLLDLHGISVDGE